jgi:hypothetical protein
LHIQSFSLPIFPPHHQSSSSRFSDYSNVKPCLSPTCLHVAQDAGEKSKVSATSRLPHRIQSSSIFGATKLRNCLHSRLSGGLLSCLVLFACLYLMCCNVIGVGEVTHRWGRVSRCKHHELLLASFNIRKFFGFFCAFFPFVSLNLSFQEFFGNFFSTKNLLNDFNLFQSWLF